MKSAFVRGRGAGLPDIFWGGLHLVPPRTPAPLTRTNPFVQHRHRHRARGFAAPAWPV
jgi:hypothetical protein